MRDILSTLLGAAGGAGQGYLRQRQVDIETDMDRQRTDAYSRMMDGQVTRDNAYAEGIAQKETEARRQREGLRAWLKARGMDVPEGAEEEGFRSLLEGQRQTGMMERLQANLDGVTERMKTLENMRGGNRLDVVRLRESMSPGPRDPDSDFESQNRMKNTFLSTMLDAYGGGQQALERVERDPRLRQKAQALGLTYQDWLAADNRRRRAAAPKKSSNPFDDPSFLASLVAPAPAPRR